MKAKRSNWLVAFLMMNIFLVGLLCSGNEAYAATSGTIPCTMGSVTWTLGDDGALVFSGSGTTNITTGYHSTHDEWGAYWSSEAKLDKTAVKSIKVATGDTIVLDTCENMFWGFENCTTIDMSGFSVDGVANMSHMFYYCQNLVTLDVSDFNTASVTDMSNMFGDCRSLTTLDVSGFSTGNVTDMSDMFYNCESLTTLDVSGFSTGNVTDMSYMFYDCGSLTTLDVSGFSTGNVTDMSRMFSGCGSLTTLDVSGFSTGSVTDMSNMFYYCESLTTLDVSGFSTGNVTDMSWMFCHCSGLSILDVSKFDTKSVTDMSYMFNWCENLTSLALSKFDTSNVTDMESMFCKCESLTALDLSSFNTSKVTRMSSLIAGCTSIAVLDLRPLETNALESPIKLGDLGCGNQVITPNTDTQFEFWGANVWYDEGKKNVYREDDIATVKANTTLYRVEDTYYIYYKYGKKTVHHENFDVELGIDPIPAMTDWDFDYLDLENYLFLGWYEDEACTIPITSIPPWTIEHVTIYPKLVPKDCTITYMNIKQATNSDDLPRQYEYGKTLVLPQLECSCYTFVGWYLDEDLTQSISTISDTTTGNIVLYARWVQNPAHDISEIDKKDATCTALGYTGDYYCNTCQKVVIYGENMPKLPHDNSVVKNVVAATCITDGYTGDKHCKTCDALVEKGNPVVKKGHEIDKTKGTITVEPTTTTEGTIQYQCNNCDYTQEESIPKVGADYVEKAGIPEETVAITDKTILDTKNDNDIAGSSFVMIQARADKTTKNSIRLKWNKVKNADGYKIYGNKCGKKNSYKLIKTITNGKKTTYTQRKLKKGTYYKYVVRAYKIIDGQELTLAASKTIHASTIGGKYGNAKSVKIKTDKKMKSKKGNYTLTIKKNKKYTIKASEVKQSKKIKQHRKIAFESTNTNIATVTKKGIVKGNKKGTCYIYAYAQNGAYKKIKVKVK